MRSGPRLLPGDSTSPVVGVLKTRLSQGTYRFKETFGVSGLVITSSTSVTQLGSLQFKFSDLNSASSWAALFDRYRLISMRVEFRPYSQQMPTGVGSIGSLHTAIDFDDAGTPASITEVERYGTYASVPGYRPLVRHFCPRPAKMMYKTVSTTGYAEGEYGLWIDMANTDIPYYGVKYALETTASAAQFTYQVFVTPTWEVSSRR